MDVLSPPQIQISIRLCPQANNCRFKDVKDLRFGADDGWVTLQNPSIKIFFYFIHRNPEAACCQVSCSELLQLCHWLLQRNTAVSEQAWLITCGCTGSKMLNDWWPSSFLLPQLKTTPLPSVISPFKDSILFFFFKALLWCNVSSFVLCWRPCCVFSCRLPQTARWRPDPSGCPLSHWHYDPPQ